MASTSVDICKLAVGHLGETGNNVSSIASPSNATEIQCARFYDIALKKALADMKPTFALRKVLLDYHDEDDDGNPVDYPLNGEWTFVYDKPSDLVKLLKVLPEGATHNAPSEDFEQFVYRPEAQTPESTDTSAETITFADSHYFVDGTPFTVASTAGGLTAGTTYYAHKISDTVISVHTSAANAIADTSRVNLTASITSALTPNADVEAILSDVEDAYADYIALVTTVTLYDHEFVLAVSYLLASMLAPVIVKGKTGISLKDDMLKTYLYVAAGSIANDKNQRQISEQYMTYKPSWISNR